jgi:hypothetical protein
VNSASDIVGPSFEPRKFQLSALPMPSTPRIIQNAQSFMCAARLGNAARAYRCRQPLGERCHRSLARRLVAVRPSAVHVAGQYDITRNFLLPVVDA